MRHDQTETVSADHVRLRTATAEALAPDTVVAGRYVVSGMLGVGGSAIVYRAHDRLLRRTVALKILRSDRLTPAALKRLQREVTVAQQVSTPHIVRVFDVGESDHGAFLTMEHVEGETLRERIARGPMPVDEAIGIGRQLLAALEALHLVGAVHRDVKPGNVLIDRDGCVKLVDLGLARDVADEEWRATQTDAVVGTFEYVPPEQLVGGDVDARTDLYSFGVVLYECLTGELPFGNRSSVSAAIAHLREKPVDIGERRVDVPRWLRRVVSQLLAKEPVNRFASAAEVGRLLERRKAPVLTPRALRAVALLFAGALLAGLIAAATAQWRAANSIRLIERGQGGALGAIDARSNVLWQREDLSMRAAVIARRGPGGPVVVAFEPEGRGIEVLDAHSGRVERRVPLPGGLAGPGSIFFPDFAPSFHAQSAYVADVDHDGFDEAYVSLLHTYYPGYVAQYDTRTERVHMIFAGSGHHRVAGTLDVNHDGRDDLILAGFANRLGWYTAIAAVDVRPQPATVDVEMVRSPDLDTQNSDATPLWYTLLPPAHLAADGVRIDRDNEVIVVQQENRTLRIGKDGFVIGSGHAWESAARSTARARAYEELRHAKQIAGGGAWQRARAMAMAAAQDGRAAREPQLAAWAERSAIRYTIRDGQLADAELRANALEADPQLVADVSFDVAHELHLVGQLDRAISWYRRGIFNDVPPSVGRMRYEFVEGAVLAAVEARKPSTAQEIIASYERTFPPDPASDVYDAYVRWRSGNAAQVNVEAFRRSPLDQAQYWAAEVDLTRGASPSQLLRRVRNLETTAPTVLGLLQSLDAELLHRLGRDSEAASAAAAALQWVEERRGSDVLARAHGDLVRERFQRLAAGR